MGHKVRLYSLGKKRLLRKCEYRNIPVGVTWLKAQKDLIFAADVRESLHVLKHNEEDNVFQVVCDDAGPKWVTCADIVDEHTVVMGDKFDTVHVCRVPAEAVTDMTGEHSGLKLRGDTAYLTGKCHKLTQLAHYHVGDTLTSVSRAVVAAGGSESLVYSTICGAMGSMIPLTTKEDVDFMLHLEMAMRNEVPPLCGRDHLMYRSFYVPVKSVVDGDLCELYALLQPEKQQLIATQLGSRVEEVTRKLDDVRNRIL